MWHCIGILKGGAVYIGDGAGAFTDCTYTTNSAVSFYCALGQLHSVFGELFFADNSCFTKIVRTRAGPSTLTQVWPAFRAGMCLKAILHQQLVSMFSIWQGRLPSSASQESTMVFGKEVLQAIGILRVARVCVSLGLLRRESYAIAQNALHV